MKDFLSSGRNVYVVGWLITLGFIVLLILSFKEAKNEYVMGVIQLNSTLIGVLGGILIPRDSARRSDIENTNIDRTTTVRETATSVLKEGE